MGFWPHQIADAWQLDREDFGQGSEDPLYYYGGSINVLDPEFAEPLASPHPSEIGAGSRIAFLKITPQQGTHVDFKVSSPLSEGYIILWLWRYEANNTWTLINVDDGTYTLAANDPVQLIADLDAGYTYYYGFQFVDEARAQQYQAYVWYAELRPYLPPLVPPPLAVRAWLPFGDNDPGDGPTPGPPLIAPPPIGFALRVVEPTTWVGTVTLSAPDADAVIVTNTPQFLVAVEPEDENDERTFTVEVQYADNPAFTNATSLTDQATGLDGGAVLRPTNPVPATTYWRARATPAGMPAGKWTDARKFTVNASGTSTTMPVTWRVAATAAQPIHLWHFWPPGPNVGDIVTIYGQGFPATGKVTFGDRVLPTTQWRREPAVAAATTDDRQIAEDTVHPEHWKIVFVAPEYNGHGDLLSVEVS